MSQDFQLSAYDFDLPQELIAQHPPKQRGSSRLLVLNRNNKAVAHKNFSHLVDLTNPGDLIVRNNSRVFPARLKGQKETGGRVEILLLEYPGKNKKNIDSDGWLHNQVTVLLKSSKRPKPGMMLHFALLLRAKVMEIMADGKVIIDLQHKEKDMDELLAEFGQIPLPPYIQRPEGTTREDSERYQTCYAQKTGSVAAPTAGLHFTPEIDQALRDKGVQQCHITLHVGYGTFAPVRSENIKEHRIHHESVEINKQTAELINQTKAKNRRIWVIGTTTARSLEFAADEQGKIHPLTQQCDLYIYPGYKFRVVENLITNFHLPCSSLMFLISALAGRELILQTYQEAIRERYRFFSYGDAMAIIR